MMLEVGRFLSHMSGCHAHTRFIVIKTKITGFLLWYDLYFILEAHIRSETESHGILHILLYKEVSSTPKFGLCGEVVACSLK